MYMKSLGAKTDKSIFAELRKSQFSIFLLYRFLQRKTILNYEILGTGAWERWKILGGIGFYQSRSARGKLGGQLAMGGQLPPCSRVPRRLTRNSSTFAAN